MSNIDISNNQLRRDSRTFPQKMYDNLSQRTYLVFLLVICAVAAAAVPGTSNTLALIATGLFFFGKSRKESVPFKLPIQAKMLDPHEVRNNQPGMAEGIFYLGNDRTTGKQVWVTNSDCRQHCLVIGTTGAGKTETLIGFAANALMWSSGFLFTDGKGDVSLFAKLSALARFFGREDDLLVLNFMTGNKDVAGAANDILSNTINPFTRGSSYSLTQMVVSLMADSGGDGAMWKGRATAMFTGVMKALVTLRDKKIIDLSIGKIRDYLVLKKIIELADPEHPIGRQLGPKVRRQIESYLLSLPGYNKTKKPEQQSQTTLDQHGYLQMQFTQILGSLADTYGHIFNTQYGEIDMTDVVLNRRLLIIMLPALEVAPEELANLGKIIVANLKGMMGTTLGNSISGSWEKVVDRRVTTSSSPFIVILDEVGYYTVDGMALLTAQARSLGFMMVLASQDINAMERLNDKEAASIIANTNLKIFMRMEDMSKTMDLATKTAGEAKHSVVTQYEGRSGELSNGYYDTLNAGIEKYARIDPRALRRLNEGEMIVTNRDWITETKGFFANPDKFLDKTPFKLRSNQFISIRKPTREEIEANLGLDEKAFVSFMTAGFEDYITEYMAFEKTAEERAAQGDELAFLAVAFREATETSTKTNQKVLPTNAMCVALEVLRQQHALTAQSVLGPAAGSRPLGAERVGSARPGALDRQMPGQGLPGRQMPGRLGEDDRGRPRSGQPSRALMGDLGGDLDLETVDGRERLLNRGRSDAFLDDDLKALPDFLDDSDPFDTAPTDIDMVGAFLDEEPDLGPVEINPDVDHTIGFPSRTIEGFSDAYDANDAVLRLLADLDYDPKTTTAAEVESRIVAATGGHYVADDKAIVDDEELDHTSFDADRALKEEIGEPLHDDDTGSAFLSAFFAEMLTQSDEDAGESGKH